MTRLAAMPAMFLMACAGCATQTAGDTVGTSSTLAESSKAEGFLRYFLADDVFSSPGVQSAQYALGIDRTCELVTPLVEAAVVELRPPWRTLYSSVAGKMGGGSDAAEDPRRGAQLLLALGLAGSDLIRSKTQGIDEVVMAEVSKISEDKIDYDARLKELEDARAENRQSCGLISSAFETR